MHLVHLCEAVGLENLVKVFLYPGFTTWDYLPNTDGTLELGKKAGFSQELGIWEQEKGV